MRYLIYGAYGFTGKLITQLAAERNHDVLLAGRDKELLKALADQYNKPFMAFSLNQLDQLDTALSQVDAVLHCAGPFIDTAEVMMNACIRLKKHYVDITGEIDVFELAYTKHAKAKKAGVLLLPGAGFDVVPSDCLATYLKSKLNTATQLEMGFFGMSKLSRGTALTMARSIHKGGAIRQLGLIKRVPAAYQTRQIHLNGRDLHFVSIPWGDVSTAYYSTGISNITVYMGAPLSMIRKMKRLRLFNRIMGWALVQKWMENKIKKTVKGPNEKMRETARSYFWGEVKDDAGNSYAAMLETCEGYKLTALTSVAIMEKLAKTQLEGGFYTPSLAFGKELIQEIPGTEKWKSITIS